MLRLDPGEGRIRVARTLHAWEGGGEYNVARGLRKCFGLRTGVVTALADNEVGRLIEDLICQGGVDTSLVRWVPYDGLGRSVRNGLNFTERGFGVRGAVGVSDRGHTAASQMSPDDVDWDHLFGADGVRWLHTGGIFAALGERTPDVVARPLSRAPASTAPIVSFDLNYRPSLWQAFGGQARAMAVNRRLVDHVDVLIGNEEDFTAALGFDVPGVDAKLADLDVGGFAAMIEAVVTGLPAPCRGRHHVAGRPFCQPQRLGRRRLGRRPAARGDAPARPRDPRPRRRRRQLRLRAHLRPAARASRRRCRRVRRRPRGARHDHAGRHLDGHARRGGAPRRRRRCSRTAIEPRT